MTKDTIYLDKAVDLADRMLPAFDTPTGIPLSMVNLGRREGVPDRDNNGLSSTAEATTLQLEFKYLSHLTDNDVYWKAAEQVRVSFLHYSASSTHFYSILLGDGCCQKKSHVTCSSSYIHIVRLVVTSVPGH